MIYRKEHPKPQFERENWINLNGIWEFQRDKSNSGVNESRLAPHVFEKSGDFTGSEG